MKTYNESVKAFLENAKANGCTESTIKSYGNIFRYYKEFLTSCGYEEASSVGTLAWKTAISPESGREDKKVSYVTLDLYLRVLKSLSDFALDMGIIDAPFVNEKMFPKKSLVSKEKNKIYEHMLTKEDGEALLTAKNAVYGRTSHTFLREKAEITMLILGGARNSELRAFTLNDLDFERGIAHIICGKGRKERYIPFPKMAQDAVNDYLNSGLRPDELPADAPLFGTITRDGKWRGLERTELSELIYRYEKAILGEDKASRSHALRHLFASIALTEGESLQDISQMLGHSSVVLTQKTYAKMLNPDILASSFGKSVSNWFEKKEVVA